MIRAVSLWMTILVLLLVVSLIVSCRDDVVVPLPASINGNYQGTYRLVRIMNVVDTQIDTSQTVEFSFRKPEFSMDISADIAESLRVFCDVLGTYMLGTGVTMTVIDSNYTRGVCTESWGPDGSFSLDQTTDTLKLTHDSSYSESGNAFHLVKELKLLPAVIK
jgi:hypothetical protein